VRTSVTRPITVGLVLAAAALLSACSGPDSAAPAPASSAAHDTSAPAPATVPDTTAPHSAHSPATGRPAQGGNDSAGDSVNCSANGGGKVGPVGGEQVDLIADTTPSGTVGCTEAFNVITDYYRDAPAKSEGTAHYLVVQGWSCMADTGAHGSGAIGCEKEGLAFHAGRS
jgi:hypothetical protein